MLCQSCSHTSSSRQPPLGRQARATEGSPHKPTAHTTSSNRYSDRRDMHSKSELSKRAVTRCSAIVIVLQLCRCSESLQKHVPVCEGRAPLQHPKPSTTTTALSCVFDPTLTIVCVPGIHLSPVLWPQLHPLHSRLTPSRPALSGCSGCCQRQPGPKWL